MLAALFFYVITGALLPYAGIYFSAQIITELSGAKNSVVLRNLVLLLLGIESAAGLIYHYFKNRYPHKFVRVAATAFYGVIRFRKRVYGAL